jgi:hypothetical protein
MDEAEPQNHATLNVDLNGVAGTWCLAYLFLPEADRDAGRRATALNMLTTSEGLPKDWEAQFPKVLAALDGGDPKPGNVVPFKPRLVVDNTKPPAA